MSRLRHAMSERSRLLLVLVCIAQFMVILDVSIVNVALPSIRHALHFSTTGLQWVVNAYTLTFAGFLMLGGRASDLVGRRRMFMAGVLLFVVASVGCAVANSRGQLIAARTLQGFGGAIVSPATLAIVTSSFADGHERNRALGIWGAIGGLGGTTGSLLGGVLTQSLGWPSIFVVNVPLGLCVLALAPAIVPEGRRLVAERHFDASGAVLVTGGLMAIVFGIVHTDTDGWGSSGVLGPIGLGVLLLAGFLVVEGRFAKAPLMPLVTFRMPLLRAANLMVFLNGAAVFTMWFFVSLYLQQVLRLSAVQTGIAFVPMALGYVAACTVAPRLVTRLGFGRLVALGMIVSSVGLVLLAGVQPAGSYFVHVLPGGVLAAFGSGLAIVPSTIVGVQGVRREQSGLASGLINTSRLMGGALGLAVLSTIAAARTRAQILSGIATVPATNAGYRLAFIAGALILAVGSAGALVLLRRSVLADASPPEVLDVAAEEAGAAGTSLVA